MHPAWLWLAQPVRTGRLPRFPPSFQSPTHTRTHTHPHIERACTHTQYTPYSHSVVMHLPCHNHGAMFAHLPARTPARLYACPVQTTRRFGKGFLTAARTHAKSIGVLATAQCRVDCRGCVFGDCPPACEAFWHTWETVWAGLTLLPLTLALWLFCKSQVQCNQRRRRRLPSAPSDGTASMNDITEGYADTAASVAFRVNLAEKLFDSLKYYPIGC